MNGREAGPRITCGDCRFWSKGHSDPGRGECLLAGGDMSAGDGSQPGMQAVVDESGTRGAHVFDQSPAALLRTESGFSCAHSEPRGDREPGETPVRMKLEAQRGARFAGTECSWEETIPGEHLYRCRNPGLGGPGQPGLIWPACPECPFLQEGASLSPIVNGDGEVIAGNEREHVGRHLSRAMDRAREALDEAARLERITRELEERHGEEE